MLAHIITSMNFGGVEVAIQKSLKDLNKNFDYKIFTVKNVGKPKIGQKNYIYLIKYIISQKWVPDVIITSLWWSHILGLILKIFGFKWYAFYHSSSSTHLINYLITRISSMISDCCFADSQETKRFIAKFTKKEIKIIPYKFSAKKAKNISNPLKRFYDFIFVGRIIKDKRIDLIINVAKKISDKIPNQKFCFVISGDSKIKINKLPNTKIYFKFNLRNARVLEYMEKSKFYLNLSDREGMSMSTIESIQSGCIPITRPVGEIKNYVSKNTALLVKNVDENSLDDVVNKLIKIYNNEKKLRKMQKLGMMKVNKLPDYTNTLRNTLTCKLNI